MTRTLSLALVLCLSATSVSADVVDPSEPEAPGYQVQVTGMDAFADRAFVNVRTRAPSSHGDQGPAPIASYTLVNEFPVDLPERLCAVPSSWVMDSPVGGLGSRMLRGARGASGDVVTDPAFIAELLALFESPEVACATPFDAPGATLAQRGVERVLDTFVVGTIEGRSLGLQRVEVAYQMRGGELVTLSAEPGSTTRPPLPAPAPSSCACRAGAPAGDASGTGLVGLGVVAMVAARLRRARPA